MPLDVAGGFDTLVLMSLTISLALVSFCLVKHEGGFMGLMSYPLTFLLRLAVANI